MPDKHEVGGSTPLEPTSRQGRQPVVGELKPGYGSHRTMGTDAGGKISEVRQKRGKAKDRERIQRISGIRESDLRRMSRKPGDRQATEAQERRQKQRRRTQGKKRFRGHAGNGRRSRLEGAEVQEDDH